MLCFLYVLFIIQATLVLKKNIKFSSIRGKFSRHLPTLYCGDSHLRYYDFSPFLLLETPGFSEPVLWAAPLDPLQGSALGPYSAPLGPQLARTMTFACRAHFICGSLFFVSPASIFSIWFINQFDESVISIYSWW